MSSATVRATNCALESWRTVPASPAVRTSGARTGSTPPTLTLPLAFASKRCGTRPFITCSRVDFPEPLGPTIATFSPQPIVKLTFSTEGSFWVR